MEINIPRNLLQLHHVHGGQQCGDHHHDPQLPPQEGPHPQHAGLGRLPSCHHVCLLYSLLRSGSSSSSGSPGCSGCLGPERSSAWRQSRCRTRWRRLTLPPSLCLPTCWTWTMTLKPPQLFLRPISHLSSVIISASTINWPARRAMAFSGDNFSLGSLTKGKSQKRSSNWSKNVILDL